MIDIDKFLKLIEKISKSKYKKICYKILIVSSLYLFVRILFQFLGSLSSNSILDKYFSYLEILNIYELEILRFLYVIAIVILLFIFLENLYNRGFLRKKLSFKNNEIYKDFNIQGFLDKKALVHQDKLILTQSSRGIITKENFGDYKMTFSFKFHKGGFGIIYRALDLNHYFMLKINEDYISPHIFYKGIWEIQKNNYIKEEYSLVLKNDVDYNAVLILKGRILTFKIAKVFKFEYIIPCYFLFGENDPDTSDTSDTNEKNKNFWALKLGFLKYGKIGFRACSDEIAEIFNLEIE